MNNSRYFTHIKAFQDNSAFIQIGPNGYGSLVRKNGNIGMKSCWSLSECLGHTNRGAWKEITAAEAKLLLNPEARNGFENKNLTFVPELL